MYNNKPERDFKGVWIPKEIWLNPDFRRNRFARDLLVEIHSLDNSFACVANNRYFAEFFGCNQQNISNTIQLLKEKGYLDISYSNEITFEGRKIKVNKAKYFGVCQPTPEVEPPTPEVEPPTPEVEPPTPEVEHNNTFNNTFNKKEKDPVQKKINKLTELLKIKDTPFEPELIHKLNEKIPRDKLEPYLNYLLNIKMQTEAKEMLLNAFKPVAFYNWYYKDFLGWENLNPTTKPTTNQTIIKKSDYNDQELQNEIEMLKSLNINFKIV